MNTRAKLRKLRTVMNTMGVDAFYVPSSDPHQSEYVPANWKRRAWLSGFEGSAGDVLVFRTPRQGAGLWTDGRYFLQAETDLAGSGIRLFRMGESGVPTIEQHLSRTLVPGSVLGLDPTVVSAARADALEAAAREAGAEVKWLDENPVDLIWEHRPPASSAPVELWPVEYSGESARAKLTRIRKQMRERGALSLIHISEPTRPC